jgi:hypothetical protein
MGTRSFRLSYPVTAEVQAALVRFPEIAKAARIPAASRSDREIVRFLRKADDPDTARLLAFINGWLPEFDADLVKQSDPFQFRRLLAELHLFARLRSRIGAGVRRPVLPRGGTRGPDIEVHCPDKLVKLEVYTPLDFVGLAFLQEHVIAIVQYTDVARGFVVDVDVETGDESTESVWYAHGLPDETAMAGWLADLRDAVQAWLARPDLVVGDQLTQPGPLPALRVRACIRELHADPASRLVTMALPTRSSDTKLLFECGTVADTVKSTWARKLAGKMRRAQAGPPADDVLRMLVVNFAASDTGWPDFIEQPNIAERIGQTVHALAAQLGDPSPYDAVLPAWLATDTSFGIPVVLDPAKRAAVDSFIVAGALNRRYRRDVQDPQAEIDALLPDGPVGPPDCSPREDGSPEHGREADGA